MPDDFRPAEPRLELGGPVNHPATIGSTLFVADDRSFGGRFRLNSRGRIFLFVPLGSKTRRAD